MPHHGMTRTFREAFFSVQRYYAAGTREILECWHEGWPARNEYVIVMAANWPIPVHFATLCAAGSQILGYANRIVFSTPVPGWITRY